MHTFLYTISEFLSLYVKIGSLNQKKITLRTFLDTPLKVYYVIHAQQQPLTGLLTGFR